MNRSNWFAFAGITVAVTVCCFSFAEAARHATSRRDLHRALERSWKEAVSRTQHELNQLKSAAVLVPPAAANSSFATAIRKRVSSAEKAVEQNAALISRVLDAEPPCTERRLWGSDDDDEEGDCPSETAVGLESEWGECTDDTSSFYTTMDEVLGHLCRDFGDSAEAPLLLDGTSESRIPRWVHRETSVLIQDCVHEISSRAKAKGSIADGRRLSVLVPGAGVGGLAWSLAQNLTGVGHVVGTECSREFLAVAAFALSSPAATASADNYLDPRRLEGIVTIAPWAMSFGNLVVGDEFDQFAPCTLQRGHFLSNLELLYVDVFAPVKKKTHQSSSSGKGLQTPQADVVVTVFTVDAVSTRHRSLIAVLDQISEMLADSDIGCWVNLGPLVYHSADAAPKLSAEEIVRYMADIHGFVDFVQPLVEIPPTPYARPQHTSMAATHHTSVFFALCKWS